MLIKIPSPEKKKEKYNDEQVNVTLAKIKECMSQGFTGMEVRDVDSLLFSLLDDYDYRELIRSAMHSSGWHFDARLIEEDDSFFSLFRKPKKYYRVVWTALPWAVK